MNSDLSVSVYFWKPQAKMTINPSKISSASHPKQNAGRPKAKPIDISGKTICSIGLGCERSVSEEVKGNDRMIATLGDKICCGKFEINPILVGGGVNLPTLRENAKFEKLAWAEGKSL